MIVIAHDSSEYPHNDCSINHRASKSIYTRTARRVYILGVAYAIEPRQNRAVYTCVGNQHSERVGRM